MLGKQGKGGLATILVIGVLVLAVLVGTGTIDLGNFNLGASGSEEAPESEGKTSFDCSKAVTLDTQATDKADSSKTMPAIKYKIGSGAVKTDADGSIGTNIGDSVTVLHAYDNTTDYVPVIKTYEVTKCGRNDVAFNEVVGNQTLTIRCFNEEGNVISDPENETIGTGESPTLRCELIGAAKKGFPLGGVVTVELSGTVYKENDLSVTGLGNVPASYNGVARTGDPVSQAIGSYSLAAAANKVRAFEVAPMYGAEVRTFYIYIPAEDAQDPTNADDLTINFYPIAGYEEEDVTGGDLRWGLVDLDNSFVASQAGTLTLAVD
jgi:hypothetical protein